MKRKSRQAALAGLLSLAVLLSGCAISAAAQEEESATALREGQSELYGKVTAATGNEITIAVGTAAGSSAQGRPDAEGDAAASDRSGDASNPDAQGGEQSRPARESAGGGPADMEGGVPGEMPEAALSGAGGTARARVSLNLTGEEQTLRIPVGTPVYVTSGTGKLTSSFMQIMVDNVVRVVLQDNSTGGRTVVSAEIVG